MSQTATTHASLPHRAGLLARTICGTAIYALSGALVSPASATTIHTSVVSSGSNTTFDSALNLDPVVAAAIARFDRTYRPNQDHVKEAASNNSIGTAQLIDPQFFPLGAPSVPLTINVNATGSITPVEPFEFYSFTPTLGATFNATVSATPVSANMLTILGSGGNFLNTASGNAANGFRSTLANTVPSGPAASLFATVTTPLSSANFKYKLQLDGAYNSNRFFTTHVLGVASTTAPEFYGINANAGDQLVLDLIPGTAHLTTLLLVDRSGNVITDAIGNGADGISSIIDFAVPSGGLWYAEVLGSTSPYHYDLSVQGATGLGPVNPFATAAVPEPATGGLFGVAAAALLGVTLRRRSRTVGLG